MLSNLLCAKCEKCGANAAIEFVNIPYVDVTVDGEHVRPSDWTHVIACPNCGDHEQHVPVKKLAGSLG